MVCLLKKNVWTFVFYVCELKYSTNPINVEIAGHGLAHGIFY
jgi:hypothetical protein